MVIDQNFAAASLKDPQKFDGMIHKLLDRHHPGLSYSKPELVWGYKLSQEKAIGRFSIKETTHLKYLISSQDAALQFMLSKDLQIRRQRLKSLLSMLITTFLIE